MSVIMKSHLRFHERGIARAIHQRRSPLEGVSSLSATATAAAAQSSPSAVVYKLPHTIKALTGIIVVLGIVVFAIAGWKLRKWHLKRRGGPISSWSFANEKASARESLFGFSGYGTDSPRPAVVNPAIPAADSGVRWAPQMKPMVLCPDPVTPPLPAKTKEYSRAGNKAEVIPFLRGAMTPKTAPRPTYFPGSDNRAMRPPPPPPSGPLPSPPHSTPSPPTPPSSSIKSLKLKFVPGFGATNAPVESPPRSSSFAHQQVAHPPPVSRSNSTSSSGSSRRKRFPRDMIVVQTFVASMDDELRVVGGETLRLIEEFADGWCLCQRINAKDGNVVKGVLPRFCLDERPSSGGKVKSKRTTLFRRG